MDIFVHREIQLALIEKNYSKSFQLKVNSKYKEEWLISKILQDTNIHTKTPHLKQSCKDTSLLHNSFNKVAHYKYIL